jgi:acylphosphatase
VPALSATSVIGMSEPFDAEPASDPARMTAWVRGRVQGVGFRWWTRTVALELGLAGSVTNLDDGRVLVVAEGSVAQCLALLGRLRFDATVGQVVGVVIRWDEPKGARGFSTG